MLKAVLDVAPVLVILMMTIVSLQLTGADFLRIWRQPSLVCVGLSSMEERARLIQGVLSITSAPGQGTAVAIRVPLENQP